MLSKACEYGIRAMIFIANQSLNGERSSIKEIANGIKSPEAFTAKILQALIKNDLLTSKKGPNGGFELTNKQINTISLSDIIISIDGTDAMNGCVLGLDSCSDLHPCPVHHKYAPIKTELLTFLHQTPLKDAVVNLHILNTHIRS